MKKLLVVLSLGLVTAWSSLSAGIIGATRWVKEGRVVTVYYDYHSLGTSAQISEHFDYIKTNILEDVTTRDKALTLLVENGCEGVHADVMRQVDWVLVDCFLEKFDACMASSFPNNVHVKSIEARQVPFLLDVLVDEWCHLPRRVSRALLADLYRSLHQYTFKMIYNSALDQMAAICLAVKGAALEEFFTQKRCELLQNLVKFKHLFCTKCDVTGADFDTAPIVSFYANPHDPKRLRYLTLVGRGDGEEDGNFFVRELLAPLVDARLVYEAVNTTGDVAVFAGVMHGVVLDDVLEDLGYKPVSSCREELKHLADAEGDDVPVLNLVPFAVYNWMK